MSIVTHLEETPETTRRRLMPTAMCTALNRHFKAEIESSYIYLGIATYFESASLPGIASWFHKQSKEELEHAMKVHKFISSRGAPVLLPTIESPATDYDSPLHAFQTGLAQEQEISLLIQEIYGIAQELREFDAATFLQWYLQEQIEEENLLEQQVNKLKLGEENPGMTLLFLDAELARR
jgi:ferritin